MYLHRVLTTCILAMFVEALVAVNVPLRYGRGDMVEPMGDEWNNPQKIAYNKEQPHSWTFPFESVESARKVLPENSTYWKSLNGTWKFHWAPDPEHRAAGFWKTDFDASTWDDVKVPMNWNIYGLQKDGSQKYGVPIYVNIPVIFQHKKEIDDWRGGVMRVPPTDWTTYKHRNEVGSYLKTFEIPAAWQEREVFISFDGVDSFFYLWVNGHYVGFSKNSRNAARFNITRYLVKGTNRIAVEVYRTSDGSFLESQDMFRLPGIFRTVAVYSTPKVYIRNLKVIPDLDTSYQNGSLTIDADVCNVSGKNVKGLHVDYSLYANKLYSDENTLVKNLIAKSDMLELRKSTMATSTTTLYMVNPKLWSAEIPNCYTLVAELKDKKNNVLETVSAIVGFRKVEIKDTPASADEFGLAGRYYYINGKTVKLKGVNHHETNPALGHAITREQMKGEIMMMKRANINQVRGCHYPDDPYWYYLCSRYGMYMEDEANIESHEYMWKEESLSHPVEFLNAHVARVMEMVYSDINHPCIIMWSLGNESGAGHNFKAAYDSLKKYDVSRPVQYEGNNDIVDMGSNMYPSVEWVRKAVTGKENIKYPFHICEHAHSMGNAMGNLVDYWTAIESTNYLCGGAIWDWIDQAMYNYDPKTHEQYMAYGGDFGDWPNDGQLVMNGIVFANMKPKPQYYEVKKVYQHIQADSMDFTKGRISVFNKYYFQDLSSFALRWSLWRNGKMDKEGTLSVPDVAPRHRVEVCLPFDMASLDGSSEYFLKVQFVQKESTPWAEAGYVQAEEQFLVRKAGKRPVPGLDGCQALQVKTENDTLVSIGGKDFVVTFNKNQGTIHSLQYGKQVVIPAGHGPRLEPWRAPVNNDNWARKHWFENGLHNLRAQVGKCCIEYDKGTPVTLRFDVTMQAPCGSTFTESSNASGRYSFEDHVDKPFGHDDCRFEAEQAWTVYPDGSIVFSSSIDSNKPDLVLARVGYVMELPETFSEMTYYGRGPADNYPDRKSGEFIEVFKTTVKDEVNIWPKPQDTGNHEDVRWCAVTNPAGAGALFLAPETMSVQALPNSAWDMMLAPHSYQLPKRPYTWLHLDCAVTGLGGNSCGPGPLEEDRVKATLHQMKFMIRPVNGNMDRQVETAFEF